MEVHLYALIPAGSAPVRKYLLPTAFVVLHPGCLGIRSGSETPNCSPDTPRGLPEEIKILWLVHKLVDVGTLVGQYRDAQDLVFEDNGSQSSDRSLSDAATHLRSSSPFQKYPERVMDVPDTGHRFASHAKLDDTGLAPPMLTFRNHRRGHIFAPFSPLLPLS